MSRIHVLLPFTTKLWTSDDLIRRGILQHTGMTETRIAKLSLLVDSVTTGTAAIGE
jgi:hypothetical protein